MFKIPGLSVAAVLLAVLAYGCDMKNEQPSSDLSAFQDLVDVPLSIKSVRWEVFGTPEYKGGVPGPTDYITLVAEVEPSNQGAVQHGTPTGTVWIAPEAARPWLPKGFREMLANHPGDDFDLSSAYKCSRMVAKSKRDKKPVEGFICAEADKYLIYLTLQDNTGT